MKNNRESGFTLPELLVATGCVIVLIVALLFFAHPKDYAIKNRDAERWVGVAQLMQATNKYVAANGKLPDGLKSTGTAISSDTAGINLCAAFVPAYMDRLPFDPTAGIKLAYDSCYNSDSSLNDYATGYTILRKNDGTVVISAANAEIEAVSLSRKF
ncbi:MAG TPA: type II secretion system protein [Patescibacteria group bacterium]|jgi:type II secretory pathway pseudopilin PulG|nr:type II secretion system protein [Patescibacteria group bacterium]